MTETMLALVWEGPREMTLREVEVPRVTAGSALVHVAHAGICGSELSGYLGQSSLRRPPLVMGHEFSGTIARVGEGVERVEVGDRVTVNPLISCGRCDRCRSGRHHLCPQRELLGAHRPGAFAEFVLVPEDNVHPLPPGLGLDAAAMTEPLACAVHASRLAGIAPVDRMVIIGAGPIGLLIFETARILGLKNTRVLDTNGDRLQVAQALGAVAGIESPTHEAPANGSFDVAVDAVGLAATRARCVELARPGGAVIFCGLHEAASSLQVNLVVRNELTLQGSFAYAPRDFELALKWLAEGKTDLRAWTAHADLSEGRDSFEKLLNDPGSTVKILLDAPPA